MLVSVGMLVERGKTSVECLYNVVIIFVEYCRNVL